MIPYAQCDNLQNTVKPVIFIYVGKFDPHPLTWKETAL